MGSIIEQVREKLKKKKLFKKKTNLGNLLNVTKPGLKNNSERAHDQVTDSHTWRKGDGLGLRKGLT